MVGMIENMRNCLIDKPIDYNGLLYSTGVSVLLLLVAAHLFKRREPSIVDAI